jgi:predicted nuclease of predicted toxin-antitoxin system
VRLLVDAQLPPALARWLTAQGHDAQHVFDVGLIDAADAAVWQRALDTSATILTKDEDFAIRSQLRGSGPPVVWNSVRQRA